MAEPSKYSLKLVQEDLDNWISQLNSSCKSPIECRLGLSLIFAMKLNGSRFDWKGDRIVRVYDEGDIAQCEMRGAFVDGNSERMAQLHIIPQAIIGKFKADFLLDVTAVFLNDHIIVNGKRKIVPFIEGKQIRTIRLPFVVIECDGHDFHERTADQAMHDRSRDRAMLEAGLHVMRFTGREIHRDPDECANQVVRVLEKLRDKSHDDSIRPTNEACAAVA